MYYNVELYVPFENGSVFTFSTNYTCPAVSCSEATFTMDEFTVCFICKTQHFMYISIVGKTYKWVTSDCHDNRY